MKPLIFNKKNASEERIWKVKTAVELTNDGKAKRM